MSTRSQIGFFETKDAKINPNEVFMYRHSDGYPDGPHGVLATLVPFAREFEKQRGLNDTEYALARCIQSMTNTVAKNDFIGYGVGIGIHGDIEYFYHVSPEEIKVYQVTSHTPENWVLESTILIKEKVTA